ncbi:MAG: AAA family ATPase, partial [Streptococcus orisratti]|nr:AAA family ATPase [Streptococcus orisratti]
FIFLIDEINRGDMAKIFGELFFSLDPNYRGTTGAISTQYANMHETDDKFYIPENVYIIGTMNDIDRSVDTFDFAMRRRFRFVEVKAEDRLEMLDEQLGGNAEEAKTRLTNLNNAISKAEGLNSHYHIGPSYFLKLKNIAYDYNVLWSDYLEPLLEDYVRGQLNEAELMESFRDAYYLSDKVEETADDTAQG